MIVYARLLGFLILLAACAHGVEDPPPEPSPSPAKKPLVPPRETSEVNCELVKTVSHKDCVIYIFDCNDGSSVGFVRCETMPGTYDPDIVPEPYATR